MTHDAYLSHHFQDQAAATSFVSALLLALAKKGLSGADVYVSGTASQQTLEEALLSSRVYILIISDATIEAIKESNKKPCVPLHELEIALSRGMFIVPLRLPDAAGRITMPVASDFPAAPHVGGLHCSIAATMKAVINLRQLITLEDLDNDDHIHTAAAEIADYVKGHHVYERKFLGALAPYFDQIESNRQSCIPFAHLANDMGSSSHHTFKLRDGVVYDQRKLLTRAIELSHENPSGCPESVKGFSYLMLGTLLGMTETVPMSISSEGVKQYTRLQLLLDAHRYLEAEWKSAHKGELAVMYVAIASSLAREDMKVTFADGRVLNRTQLLQEALKYQPDYALAKQLLEHFPAS